MIDAIEGVDKDFEGKKGHFNIKMKNGKGIHLKHDDPKEAAKWTEAIEKICEVYKGKTILDFDMTDLWKDTIDPRVINMIMEELESNRF